MKTNEKPIIVEQMFDSSIETVWKSITEIELMKQWFFNNIPDFKAEVGFETQFNISNEGRNFLHKWKVTEVIPEKLIAYNWKFEEQTGEFVTTFELLRQDESTLLKLTARVLEDFPDNIPEFTRESGVAGWKYFIQGSLKEFLAVK